MADINQQDKDELHIHLHWALVAMDELDASERWEDKQKRIALQYFMRRAVEDME